MKQKCNESLRRNVRSDMNLAGVCFEGIRTCPTIWVDLTFFLLFFLLVSLPFYSDFKPRLVGIFSPYLLIAGHVSPFMYIKFSFCYWI